MSKTELSKEDRIYKVFESLPYKVERERKLKSECELITGRRCGNCDQCVELSAREDMERHIYDDYSEAATRMAIIVQSMHKNEEDIMILRRENRDLKERLDALEKWAAATDRTLEHHGVI